MFLSTSSQKRTNKTTLSVPMRLMGATPKFHFPPKNTRSSFVRDMQKSLTRSNPSSRLVPLEHSQEAVATNITLKVPRALGAPNFCLAVLHNARGSQQLYTM